MAINFTPTAWKDGQEGGTPITAAQLNRVETAVQSVCDAALPGKPKADIEPATLDLIASDSLTLSGDTNKVTFHCTDGICWLRVDLNNVVAKSTEEIPIAKIPEGYNPDTDLIAMGALSQGGWVTVTANTRDVKVRFGNTGQAHLVAGLCWPASRLH